MLLFAELINQLNASVKTNDKLLALAEYFLLADDRDKVWTIALFSGRRPRRTVTTRLLREWCVAETGLPEWLFEESYQTVGDLAETIALLLPEPAESEAAKNKLHYYIEALMQLEKAPVEEKQAFITGCWRVMNREERFVLNKLITGGFRIGVSQQMMVNALARVTQLEAAKIAHLLSGNWDPQTITFAQLLDAASPAADTSKPYPFYLSYALEDELPALGPEAGWQAEYKWDGIRGQLICRSGELHIWSRGEELMDGKFPEYDLLLPHLPDGTALDGEIIIYHPGREDLYQSIGAFSLLQTRIGRKQVNKKQLQEAPVAFMAYDLLEREGRDCRNLPLQQRREYLEKLVAAVHHPQLQISPLIPFSQWNELAAIRQSAREKNSEGLMLKRKASVYQTGRKRGDWWKWKTDPFSIDAVLIYAQKGHGRRSNLYTDYTFALRDGDKLVSFTKAYSGLTDKEFAEVDAFVKSHSLEKFGPVRTVEPLLVFEIAFEGISRSKRHKSGVALRFPRMARWRRDKPASEADTLEDLMKLLGEMTEDR